jgi:hypothetical protein
MYILKYSRKFNCCYSLSAPGYVFGLTVLDHESRLLSEVQTLQSAQGMIYNIRILWLSGGVCYETELVMFL